MFTGLVEEVGTCTAFSRTAGGTRLSIKCGRVSSDVRDGDSVAVNGCCLTVTSAKAEELGFDVLAETLRCTNLGELEAGSLVNLERPLAAGARLGGHFVQGHVDTTAEVIEIIEQGADLKIVIAVPEPFRQYIAYKGSVAVNGVSLTIADAGSDRLTVWIIPHTRTATNLGKLSAGKLVNLEVDILAKYVERLVNPARPA